MRCPTCNSEALLYQQFGWRCSHDPAHPLTVAPPVEIMLHVTLATAGREFASVPYRGVRYFLRRGANTRIVWFDGSALDVMETVDQLDQQVLRG